MASHRRRTLLLATVALLATLPAGAAATGSTESITLAEFTLTPQTQGLERSAGTWTFTATNAGSFPHTLNLEATGGSADLAASGPIAAGHEATLPAVDLAPGSYRLYCAIHPGSMHVDLVFVGVPTSGAPTADGVTAAAATVHVTANASGDASAVARINVAPAATPTAGVTVDLPLAGFADQPVSHLFAGLAADTDYLVEVNAHGRYGDSVIQTTTFRTASQVVYQPAIVLAVPSAASVAAWRVVRGSIDPGTGQVAGIQVSATQIIQGRCFVSNGSRFRRAPCGAAHARWVPAALVGTGYHLRLAGLRPGLVRVVARAVDASGHELARTRPAWRRIGA